MQKLPTLVYRCPNLLFASKVQYAAAPSPRLLRFWTVAHTTLSVRIKQDNFKKILMPRSAYGAMSVTALTGLLTLTFNLLTTK